MLAGRYKKVRELGSGGCGVTYLAKDHLLPGKPLCVIKELNPIQKDPRVQQLFEKEAIALQRLGKHPQIPQLLAFAVEKRKPYIVQEYIEGHDLSQEIASGKQLSEGNVIKLLQDVLEVLAFVHQQNVIHRDLKPANLMRRKSDGKIVLIDFGTVKQISSAITNPQGGVTTHIAIGTPGYTPPEQYSCRPCPASDVYAVGITAIYALTGTFPNALEAGEVIWQTAGVSKPLAELLTKMVRSNYSSRYPSAVEALQALENLSQSQPLPSPPPTLIFPTSSELHDQALAKQNKGDDLGAIADYTQAIQLKPDYTIAYYNRGIARYRTGDKQGAIEDYTQAIELNKDWGNASGTYYGLLSAYYNRGLAYNNKGDKQSAIADYTQAIQLKPDFASAYYQRARIRRDGNDKPGALADFQKAANLYQQQGDAANHQAAIDRIAKLNANAASSKEVSSGIARLILLSRWARLSLR